MPPVSKPLVYVDQNVLGAHLSGRIKLGNVSGIQWVYSKEHFTEIRRSEDPAPYIAVLDEIDARLLDLNMYGSRITGSASLIEGRSAAELYANHCVAVEEVSFDDSLFDPFLAWINGGGDGDMLRAFPRHVADQLLALTEYLPRDVLAKEADTLTKDLGATIAQMATWGNDIETNRAAFGVGKGAIGSVSGSNQLEKIWNMVGPSCPGITSDQFFGFDPPDKQGYETWPVYLGIVGCCAVLDVLGFQSEKKSRKVDRLPNVRSDSTHIAMGAFCSAILSADKRLVRRAKAIYEHKAIGTQCLLLAGPG